MLVHIQRYLEIDQLRPSKEWGTGYEFKLNEFDGQGTPDAARTVSLEFQNRQPEQVWITIMVLSHDWSVSLIIPESEQLSEPVQGGKSMEQIRLKLEVPKSLQASHDHEVRDRFKMIISRQAHDFSHYELPSIQDFTSSVERSFHQDMPGQWIICERIVNWTIP